MRNLFCVVLISLLAGCAQQGPVKLYSGPERSASQVLVVQVPADLEIQSINGQKVAALDNLVRGDDQQVHLLPGEYQIDAYYRRVFDIGGMTHEVVRSRAATFNINGQAGETWRLGFQKPANLDQAREMSKRFDAWAENPRTGQRIQAQEGSVPSSVIGQLFSSGDAAPRDRNQSVEPLGYAAPAESAASVMMPVSAAVAPRSTVAQPAQAALPHSDATLTTLQQLWLLLTPESRKSFLEWAEQ
ncbi:hypothetical protein CK507_03885 [Pseudomonas sp. WN033]|nr:hypothetical protein CK507_03885 [Pseudomonas sp. WN033]